MATNRPFSVGESFALRLVYHASSGPGAKPSRAVMSEPSSRYAAHLIRLLVASTLSLWIADVLTNLALLERMLVGEHLPSRGSDFGGLLLAEVQVSFAIVLFGVVSAHLATRVLRRSDVLLESSSVAAAAVSSVVMLAGLRVAWEFDASDIWLAFAVAGMTFGVIWAITRSALRRRAPSAYSLSDIMQVISWPALLVGFCNQAVGHTVNGRWDNGLVSTLAILSLLGAWFQLESRRLSTETQVVTLDKRGVLTLGKWSPLALTICLSAYFCLVSFGYGHADSVTEQEGANQGPDIVLIVLDTVRADHLKRYGYERNTMPALEEWAEQAMVAHRAVSPAGWTGPAHASILSGRPVSGHGVHYSAQESVFATRAVEGVDWLPGRLADAGYYRLAVTANPLALSRETAADFSRVLSPYRKEWQDSTVGGLVDHFSPFMQNISEAIRWRIPYLDAEQITDIAMRAVPDGDAPLFLFINFLDAHSPYNPPARALRQLEIETGHLFGRYRSHRELITIWDSLPIGKSRHLIDLYDGELRGMDAHVWRLLQFIDQRLGTDTVVIVTSDHGEELGEAGRVGHEYGLAQALLHVPLFVRAPGIPAGGVNEIISLRNLYNFIVSLSSGSQVGVEDLTGHDEYGVIAERYPSGSDTRTYGSHYGRPWVALFDDESKGVGPSPQGCELFDVQSAGFDSELRQAEGSGADALCVRIDEYWQSNRDRREEKMEFDMPTGEELRRLRSLGYVQ